MPEKWQVTYWGSVECAGAVWELVLVVVFLIIEGIEMESRLSNLDRLGLNDLCILLSFECRLIGWFYDFNHLLLAPFIFDRVLPNLVVSLRVLENRVDMPVVVDYVLLRVRLERLPHFFEVRRNVGHLKLLKVAELLVVVAHQMRRAAELSIVLT